MNAEELRADIPALEETVYLNTGAGGPSPRRVVDAARAALEHSEYRAPVHAFNDESDVEPLLAAL